MVSKIKEKIMKTTGALAVVGQTIAMQTQKIMATTFWENETAPTNLIQAFSTAYNKYFILIMLVEAFFFVITKDDKKKGYLKVTMIGCAIVYIFTFPSVQEMITKSLEAIAGWF